MPNAPSSNVQAFTRLEKSVSSGKEWECISKKVMSGVVGRESMKPLDKRRITKCICKPVRHQQIKKNRTGYATISLNV